MAGRAHELADTTDIFPNNSTSELLVTVMSDVFQGLILVILSLFSLFAAKQVYLSSSVFIFVSLLAGIDLLSVMISYMFTQTYPIASNQASTESAPPLRAWVETGGSLGSCNIKAQQDKRLKFNAASCMLNCTAR